MEEERSKTIRLNELLEAAKRQLQTLQEEMTHSDEEQRHRAETEADYIKVRVKYSS